MKPCIVCNRPIDQHDIAQGSACVRKMAKLKLASGIPREGEQCMWCKRPATMTVAGRPHCGERHKASTGTPWTFNQRTDGGACAWCGKKAKSTRDGKPWCGKNHIVRGAIEPWIPGAGRS